MSQRAPDSRSGGARRRGGDRPRVSAFRVERLLRQALLDPSLPVFGADAEFADWLDQGGEAGLLAARKATIASDPRERAQDLAYDAYEQPPARALATARRALRLDPSCIDARAVRAYVTRGDSPELIADLEEILADAERELGEEFFARADGDFRALVPARPYLRTALQLSVLLWDAGYRLDAVSWSEHLLDLDPRDHGGHAPLLVGSYLAMGEVQRAWDVLERYDRGNSALMAWAWVLLHLLVDDEDRARVALDRALALNPWAAAGLLAMGEEPEPQTSPFVIPGSRGEADLCEQVLGEAWDRAPFAQDWLEEVLSHLGLLEGGPDDDDGGGAPPPLRIVN
jgi:tetratricopeptide (TPR) repeat protein